MDEPPRGPTPPPHVADDQAGYEADEADDAAEEAPRDASGGQAVSAKGSRRLSIPGIVIGLAIIGSLAFIGYVVLRVEENQIPLVASGFVVLGASLAALALWCVVGIWRAASRARGARALGLAIVGGLAGLGAIGCFTIAALSAMVWNT
jgi:hypothetical protein